MKNAISPGDITGMQFISDIPMKDRPWCPAKNSKEKCKESPLCRRELGKGKDFCYKLRVEKMCK